MQPTKQLIVFIGNYFFRLAQMLTLFTSENGYKARAYFYKWRKHLKPWCWKGSNPVRPLYHSCLRQRSRCNSFLNLYVLVFAVLTLYRLAPLRNIDLNEIWVLSLYDGNSVNMIWACCPSFRIISILLSVANKWFCHKNNQIVIICICRWHGSSIIGRLTVIQSMFEWFTSRLLVK